MEQVRVFDCLRKVANVAVFACLSLVCVNQTVVADDLHSNPYLLGSDAVGDVNYYSQQLCQSPGFKCIPVSKNDNWFELFPNKVQRDMVMRLNRANVSLRYLPFIVVPRNFASVSYRGLAPLPHHINHLGSKLIYVDLSVFAFGAYGPDGNLVFWGPASGGEDWCDDLHRSCASQFGHFHVYRKQGADCFSNKYPMDTNGGAPMPYCMHYFEGFALHGSTLSGFVNRSKGCVRLFYQDAQWLNEHFAEVGTEVIVKR